MAEKIVVGPFDRGLRKDVTAFNIDNTSFPTLTNAYQWRGRIKRKRGTSLLNRLERYFNSSVASYGSIPTITLDGSGNGNLLTGFSLQANGNIVAGTVIIADVPGNTYKDIPEDGTLVQTALNLTAITDITQDAQAVLTIVGTTYTMGQSIYITGVLGMTQINNAYYTITNVAGNLVTINVDSAAFSAYISGGNAYVLAGSINYATGAITVPSAAGVAVKLIMNYFPDLPVMGIRDLDLRATQFAETIVFDTVQFPMNLGFDTRYSYNISSLAPYNIWDVSFYKNPPVDGATLPGYVPKTVVTPTSWRGQDYQQFWTVNYESAIWATNGIDSPFTGVTIGMQFKPITVVDNITTGPPAVARLHIASHGLEKGDFLFVNEVATTTGINWQTGYVVSNDPQDPNFVDVEFPNATINTDGTGGIAQYLTRKADPTKDCIRWYDGDPTNGSVTTPSLIGGLGWVNFMPPLSQSAFSIDQKPRAIYYLVGARMIVPFKDRLLFFGPVIQTSAAASVPLYLQDTVIYSLNGTPYYTASFTNSPSATIDSPTSASNVYHPILVPKNQTAVPNAYFEDSTGFGGNIAAGFEQPITTVSQNQDVLIVGFSSRQAQLVYTGDDIIPFVFFVINSELGSSSTFSIVNFDRGVQTIGQHGFVVTSQISAERPDLEIPDNVFEFNLKDNGTHRVTAVRDFINEWAYFTYSNNQPSPGSESPYKFPNQTLQYNYRDKSWAIFNETYTSYGTQRKATGYTWATIGTIYETWSEWNAPWNAGASTLLQPKILAGNQQGFIMIRDEGTGEGPSLYIRDITATTITSPDHGLNDGDFIIITEVLGTIGTQVNNKIFSVKVLSPNTFNILPSVITGTYSGGGIITRMYIPFIQSKQFNPSWSLSRKTRIGQQAYLFTTTANAQIEVQLYLSTDANNPYNFGPIIPSVNVQNSSLISSDTMFTCPESTNLGLTPANINLQMVTANTQAQTWHRMDTSLLGDTVQVGFTLSDEQMRTVDADNKPISQFDEIELHSMVIDISPSMVLA